jgi:hypothetical protein
LLKLDSKLINTGLGIGTGVIVGMTVIEVLSLLTRPSKSMIVQALSAKALNPYRSYATYTCSQLCSLGRCDAYNCRGDCTAGCTACGGVTAVGRNCPSCSTLCTNRLCSDYNCRCTAGCTACGGVAAVGNCGSTTTTPTTGTTTGSAWYKAKGSTKALTKSRCDGESNRWEFVSDGWWNGGFEVYGYLTVSSGKMDDKGHIGLKHGGPEHTPPCGYKLGDKCCCWWDSGLRRSGAVYLQNERPHPTNSPEKWFGNIGRKIDTGSVLGVRWGIYKESSTSVRVMFWTDTSGGVNYNWVKRYDYLDTGGVMPSSYYSKIPSKQNVEIRISDVPCSSISWKSGPTGRRL